eukprot:CAMPEP_0206455870 /NCGR_PEP_ID=MMETSP0324_2-20121206/22031_1 /ASSEMBLY_ACC=CAM_ASM_000836 /TAXON_ID=2866 /ORGANISM="Crypthecodinium cohnii, Strain Seligo" /LENGTH=46 /DNA_ID= /DNA_START= /DNA_END= /DNA_ORIENTATION=
MAQGRTVHNVKDALLEHRHHIAGTREEADMYMLIISQGIQGEEQKI